MRGYEDDEQVKSRQKVLKKLEKNTSEKRQTLQKGHQKQRKACIERLRKFKVTKKKHF